MIRSIRENSLVYEPTIERKIELGTAALLRRLGPLSSMV